MSNVAKLKKKAAEFEAKKQFDKALSVYQQILNSAAPGDEEVEVSLFNRVGDILLRQGNTAEAVTYYEKAVDLYAEGGFFNNAIALCNKILRQSPGRSVVYYKLGKISAKKGFRSDAKQNFLEYADRMQQAGQIDEAFRALKEFADLVPDQEDVRLMLAEQLSKKDRKKEALEQLQILYEKYEHEGRAGEAKAALDRMRTLDPTVEPKSATAASRTEKPADLIFLDVSWDGSSPRSATPPSRSTMPTPRVETPRSVPPAAAAMPTPAVSPAYPTPSHELETPSLLAPEATRTPTPSVLDATPSLDESDLDAAPISGLSTGGGYEDAHGGAVDELPLLGLEATSFEMQDLEPPMSGSAFGALTLDTPTHDDDFGAPAAHDLVLPGELPTLGGDLSFIVPPDESFGGDSDFDRSTPTGGTALEPLELDRPLGLDDDDADDRGGELTFLETGANDLQFLDLSDRADDAPAAHDVTPSELALAAELDAPLVDEPETMHEESFGALELLAPVDEETASLPESESVVDTSAAGSDIFIMQSGSDSFDEYAPGAFDDAEPVRDDGAGSTADRAEMPALDGPSFDAASLDAPPRHAHAHAHAQAIAALRARVDGNPGDGALRRRLGELLLDAGDREEGLAELERAMASYEKTGDIDQARSVVDDVIRLNPNSVAHHQKRVEYAFRSNDRARLGDAYLELADALFRSGQGDKARAVYDRVLELAPDNARARAALNIVATPSAAAPAVRDEPPAAAPIPPFVAGRAAAAPPTVAPTEPSAAATAAPTPAPAPAPAPAALAPTTPPASPAPRGGDDGDFVNLGDWLLEDSTPKSTRMVTDAREPVEGEEFDFAEMLAKFKQGVAENVDEDDHESHYDLGVAFKEMGLVEEAISEFQKALRSSARRARTYEALGQCFLEQSQFQVASTVLSRALAEPGVGDEQLVGVLYLLGYCHEALQQWAEALTYYQRVFAVDIEFRDVSDRIAALERVAT